MRSFQRGGDIAGEALRKDQGFQKQRQAGCRWVPATDPPLRDRRAVKPWATGCVRDPAPRTQRGFGQDVGDRVGARPGACTLSQGQEGLSGVRGRARVTFLKIILAARMRRA